MWRRAQLYWHTIRHLQVRQVAARLWRHLPRALPDTSPPPPPASLNRARWQRPAAPRASLVGACTFRFLNQVRSLDDTGWDDAAVPLLWRYHLHYFEDLVAEGASRRHAWHVELMRRWLADNPPCRGTGWAPYPTSLRIVNWIRWQLAGNELPGEAVHSLAVQARWLARNVEWHLLGNHLMANAKALVFAGLFFSGAEAQRWFAQGARILLREIGEQILADGGHFERSPMYHALACVDMLDLLNLLRTTTRQLPLHKRLEDMIARRLPAMLHWLDVMTHPDGEIAFFNDAAIGMAPSPAAIAGYARRLGVAVPRASGAVEHLQHSGYVRLQLADACVIADVAPVGPDYIPGHAHADTLSFEMSVAGRRVLVNTGTSTYEAGRQRHYERSTAAHNTVMVDGQDSSEVWGAFRVARRARPFDVAVEERGDTVVLRGAHDGYLRLPGRVVHRRCWRLLPGELLVEDELQGRFGQAVAHFHLHPDARGLRWDSNAWVQVAQGAWHPEFGRTVPNRRLEVRFEGSRCRTRFRW